IYNGRAHYWDWKDPTKDGGPPLSWDFSMEVQGLPRWAVRVKPGDVLRSNATYDTSTLSAYEDMGISVTLLAPDTADGKPTAPGASIYHTVTSCGYPCLGPRSASFPEPNGTTSQGRGLDFDSSELGIGAPYVGATSQKLDWSLPVDQKHGFKPGELVTYYCRI